MSIDIVTLKLVLCIINILNLFILYIQYLSNKEYKGILHWIAGFGFIAFSQIITLKFIFPSNEFISLFSDLSILIGFSIVSIGISYFLNVNFKSKVYVSLVFLALVIVSVVFFTGNLVTEKFLLSFFKSIICYHIVANLFCCKIESIKKTTNFIGALFFIYASVFLAQSVSVLINGINTHIDSPIFIIIYLFSIIVGIISTFGFTFLVNQRLIGERDKAERNAQLIQYAVNNTSDAVYWVKKDGSFLELNNAACNILGYTYNELMKLKVQDIDPDYNHEVWPKHWDELKEKKSMTFNSSHMRKDGSIVPTEVNANYIFYNGDEINCAFVREITERKLAEEKLIATKNHLKAILDTEPECIKLLTQDLILQDMNPAGLAMVGADNLEQVSGKNLIEVIDLPYREKFKQLVDAVFRGENRMMDYKITGLKGVQRWLETNAVPMKDSDGNIVSMLAITRDISERKKAEQKVHELMLETIDKNNRLQNFAHIVSHNIRSHAANFSGLLDIIKAAETEEEKQLYFEYLTSSSVKLSETIDNLNEIITIQTASNLPLEKLDLYNEVEKTIQSQRLNIVNYNIQIDNMLQKNVAVKAVPAYLDSIVLNLITNAIKYRSNDRTPHIKVSCVVDNKFTQLIIEDNGIGIDLEKNGNKLFGMYKTFNGNSDAKGIGLFITKNQIEALKGKIEVTSQLGVGTTFKVYFPNAK